MHNRRPKTLRGNLKSHMVGNKAKGESQRYVCVRGGGGGGVRNVRFSEKLACFVFLLPPF